MSQTSIFILPCLGLSYKIDLDVRNQFTITFYNYRFNSVINATHIFHAKVFVFFAAHIQINAKNNNGTGPKVPRNKDKN